MLKRTPTPPPGPFPWIRAWGWMMGSFKYYIDQEIERARTSGAPANATFRRYPQGGGEWDGKTWATTDDIENANTRYVLENEFGPLPEKQP